MFLMMVMSELSEHSMIDDDEEVDISMTIERNHDIKI